MIIFWLEGGGGGVYIISNAKRESPIMENCHAVFSDVTHRDPKEFYVQNS